MDIANHVLKLNVSDDKIAARLNEFKPREMPYDVVSLQNMQPLSAVPVSAP